MSGIICMSMSTLTAWDQNTVILIVIIIFVLRISRLIIVIFVIIHVEFDLVLL